MPFKSDEIAYAAGLFEGEGSITRGNITYRNRRGERCPRKTLRPRLMIGMTDREPLERWREAMGMGRIYGPYQQGNYQPHFRLSVEKNGEVERACALMWEWLSPRRREQIERILGGVPNSV